MKKLLEIKNLIVDIRGEKGDKPLIKGIDFDIKDFEVVALVGGSGSGKTTLGLSILQLLPMAMTIKSGNIIFNNEDLLDLSQKRMQKIRGKEISMVFQEPLSALNPVFRVESQIAEVLKFHTDLSSKKIKEKVLELLDAVEVPDPKNVAIKYPHQLSGGLRQRVMIAQAIAGSPKIIIADEPTSNLDVTIQARILELFKKLRNEFKMSMFLITHDLGVVKYLADRVFILHDGRVVESNTTEEIFANPKKEFTQRLMEAIKI